MRCAALHLKFDSVDGQARIRELEGTGAVSVSERQRRFTASGQGLSASFTDDQQLCRAIVSGTEATPAFARYGDYALRAGVIDVDADAELLRVDGPSRLAFRSRRSLKGQTRGRPELITVSSTDSMRIDGQKDAVYFLGHVVAGTGDEKLLADTLTLLLANAEPEQSRDAWSPNIGAGRALRVLASAALNLPRMLREAKADAAEPADRDSLSFVSPRSRGGTRKELARVLAQNAAIQSETYQPGDAQPLVHQSIAAPEMEIDVRQRCLRATGKTTLLMTDRRLPEDVDTTPASAGIASALISRGPSETAMACDQFLIYMMGQEGPARRDSVLMEGNVFFRHVTGRQMAGIEMMLPQVVGDPTFLETHKIQDRNTYLECGRLEAAFAGASPADRDALIPRSSLQLALLNARDNVFLSDQQNTREFEVYAQQLEFDREGELLRLLAGSQENDNVRVYEQDAASRRFSNPVIAREVVIDLRTNTVQAKKIRGQIGG